MVLNSVTKFHKILNKNIWVRERTSFGQAYVCKYVQMDGQGLYLMPRPLSWGGGGGGGGRIKIWI